MNTLTTIHFWCHLCANKHQTVIQTPEGWSNVEDIYEHGYCPEHEAAAAWLAAQCPGCVASFPDCGLGRALESNERALGFGQRAEIQCGKCPFRVNGTFSMSARGVETMDISDQATTEEGDAMLKAVDDYRKVYGKGVGQ